MLQGCIGSGVVKGGDPPNCVQDHSKSLNPCRSWGVNPLECLRRSVLPPPKTMTLATPLCFGVLLGLTPHKLSKMCFHSTLLIVSILYRYQYPTMDNLADSVDSVVEHFGYVNVSSAKT